MKGKFLESINEASYLSSTSRRLLSRFAIALLSLTINAWAITSVASLQLPSQSLSKQQKLSMNELNVSFIRPRTPVNPPEEKAQKIPQKASLKGEAIKQKIAPSRARKTEKALANQDAVKRNRNKELSAKAKAATTPTTRPTITPAMTTKDNSIADKSTRSKTRDTTPRLAELREKASRDLPIPLISTPTFLSPPEPPRYPVLARKRGQQGTVWLDIWLDATGQQTKRLISKSSGHASLDKAALSAVSSWHFQAYRHGGQSVASRVTIPLEFSLN